MTADHLLLYLHDHLAGASFAVDLLEGVSKQRLEPAAAALTSELKEQVKADRDDLERLANHYGSPSRSLKDVAAWMSEKTARLKLDLKTPLGIFEAVEFLCLGVRGKKSLWDALNTAGGRQTVIDLDRLSRRAISQYDRLEALRLDLAKSLFEGWSEPLEFVQIEGRLREWATRYGVELKSDSFASGKAGQFDGKSITMNSSFHPRERLFYELHAMGSIVLWSKDKNSVQQLFDDLRDAKAKKSDEPKHFADLMQRFRAFETEASEYGISILSEIDALGLAGDYTNFMQADLESITQFHETGKAPVWKEFFARWNQEAPSGGPRVSFEGRAVPAFYAIPIEKQEILQQQ